MIDVTRKELPEGWQWTTMEDIADVIGGGTPKSKEKRYFEGGNIPWLTPADLSGYKAKHISKGARNITEAGLNSSSAKLMPAGTVLFTSRAPIGYVAIATNEISTNQGFKSFVLKSEDILPDYVYWWLKGNKQLAESMASGTTFLELSGSKAKQLPIPIAPPEQQKHIVAKIEELFSHIDAGIEALKKAKQLLKQYRQSVLKAAVTGELTKEWREVNKGKLEPASQLLERILKERRQKWEEQQLEQLKTKGKMPKDNKWKGKYIEPVLPEDIELPSEWITASLDQLTEYITSGSRGWAKYYADSGVTFIRAQNLKYDVLDLDSIAYVSLPDKAEGMRTRVKYGDLLITITGANVTKTGYVNIELDEAYVSQHVALCRPAITRCVRYLYIYLISKDGARKKLEEAAYGAGKPGLNLDNLKTLQIALPSIEEQEEIVRLVEQRFVAIQRLDDDLGVQLRKAEKNKQSVLASAFSGMLRE